MDGLETREWVAVRWALGQLLVFTSLLGGLTIDLGATELTLFGLVLVPFSFVIAGRLEQLPNWWLKGVPIALLFLVGGDFLLSRGDVLPSLYRMVVLLSLFRLLQVRRVREELQLLLLTLFMLLLTGVLSQDVFFAGQLFIYGPVAVFYLFAINLSTGGDGRELHTEGAVFRKIRWRRLLGRLWKRIDRMALSLAGGLFIVTSGMSALFFILLPRFDIGQALPFPSLQTDRSLSGFSDRIRYGDVVSILEDESLAMRVDVNLENPPARPYWRMVVLDAYLSDGFQVSPQVRETMREISRHRFNFRGPQAELGADWTLYLEGGISAYVPTSSLFGQLLFNSRQDIAISDLVRIIRQEEINATTLSIRLGGASFGDLVPAGPLDRALGSGMPLWVPVENNDYFERIQYPATTLVLPKGEANRAILERHLQASGVAQIEGRRAQAQQIINYLQEGRGYSLQSRIPEGEGDRVLRWLDSGAPGHCELYAGAAVLLARAAGLPARIVTGFVGGDWNGFENYYMVRNRHAHAWCEIFLGPEGWLRVDATPGYGTGEATVEAALSRGSMLVDLTFAAYLDSLRVLWFRRVIQFDADDQELLVETVQDFGSISIEALREQARLLWERLRRDLSLLRNEGRWVDLLVDVGSLLVTGFFGMALVHFWRKWRRERFFEERVRRKAGQVLRKLRHHPPVPERLARIVEVEAIRYGPRTGWPADVERFLRRASHVRSRG
jgi:hypothetical protein